MFDNMKVSEINKLLIFQIAKFKNSDFDISKVKVDGLNYAPPDFLRLSMYLELSRPKGDTDRWEKVLTRLDLLNQHHPIAIAECEEKDFVNKRNIPENINQVLRDTLIDNGVVFFGGYASLLYSKYMDKEEKNLIKTIPDFDVLSKEPKRCVNILAEAMRSQKQKTKINKSRHLGTVCLTPRLFQHVQAFVDCPAKNKCKKRK